MTLPRIALPGLPGKTVGKVGLGLMTMPSSGSPEDDDKAFAAMLAALENGSNLFNTATFYGPPTDPFANLKLVRRFFDAHPDKIDEVVLSVKGGYKFPVGPVEDVNETRAELEKVKSILGNKKIDLFEYARVPRETSIDQHIKELAALRDQGFFSAISLSEASANTIRTAKQIAEIAFVELEVNLWSLEPTILDAIETARSLGVPVLGYSPHGSGFLTGKYKTRDDLDGMRKLYPRFSEENFPKNLVLVDKVKELADKSGVGAGTIAIAWAMGVSDNIIALPGSSNPSRVKENIAAAEFKLPEEDKKELDDFLKTFKAAGTRYPEAFVKDLMR